MKCNQYFDWDSKIHSLLFISHSLRDSTTKVTHKTFPSILSKHSLQHSFKTFPSIYSKHLSSNDSIELTSELSSVYFADVTTKRFFLPFPFGIQIGSSLT